MYKYLQADQIIFRIFNLHVYEIGYCYNCFIQIDFHLLVLRSLLIMMKIYISFFSFHLIYKGKMQKQPLFRFRLLKGGG